MYFAPLNPKTWLRAWWVACTNIREFNAGGAMQSTKKNSQQKYYHTRKVISTKTFLYFFKCHKTPSFLLFLFCHPFITPHFSFSGTKLRQALHWFEPSTKGRDKIWTSPSTPGPGAWLLDRGPGAPKEPSPWGHEQRPWTGWARRKIITCLAVRKARQAPPSSRSGEIVVENASCVRKTLTSALSRVRKEFRGSLGRVCF